MNSVSMVWSCRGVKWIGGSFGFPIGSKFSRSGAQVRVSRWEAKPGAGTRARSSCQEAKSEPPPESGSEDIGSHIRGAPLRQAGKGTNNRDLLPRDLLYLSLFSKRRSNGRLSLLRMLAGEVP